MGAADLDVCQWCDRMVNQDNMEVHMRHCSERPVKHRACGLVLPLSQLEHHKTSCLCPDVRPHNERRRMAFIVGVNEYGDNSLHAAENDAAAIAKVYRSLGFQTSTLKSPSKEEYQIAKRTFLDAICPDTIAAFHFSGHGGATFDHSCHVNKNYLYLSNDSAIDAKKLALDISARKPLFSLITLDACRVGEKDLLQMDIPNTITILSTAPGKCAYEYMGQPLSAFCQVYVDTLGRYGFEWDIRHVASHVQHRMSAAFKCQLPSVVSNLNIFNDLDLLHDARLGDPGTIL